MDNPYNYLQEEEDLSIYKSEWDINTPGQVENIILMPNSTDHGKWTLCTPV